MKRFFTFRTYEFSIRIFLVLLIAWGVSNMQAQCDLTITVNGGNYTSGNVIVQLNPGDCYGSTDVLFNLTNNGCAGCLVGGINVLFPDGSGQAFSSVDRTRGIAFPIGVSEVTFSYLSCDGNSTITSIVGVDVLEYATPITALACNDQVQISLNENCTATVGADLVLEGGPYKCYDNYVVTVRDKNGIAIDRDNSSPGVQLDRNDFGNCYSTTVTDPATGNSCWGTICIEDKLAPKLTCPRDITLECGESIHPNYTGYPDVFEACDPNIKITFTDRVEDGSCALDYDRKIYRTFKAVDPSGNETTCDQVITINLGVLDLTTLQYPPGFDGLTTVNPLQPHLDPLKCDEQRDDVDYAPHYSNPAFACGVDDYILDNDYLSKYGDRRPDTLGWNYISGGKYEGHPAPNNIYYPAKPGCWPENTVVQWRGTGFPGGVDCSNIQYTYSDVVIDIADQSCNAGDVGCYKILRRWTLLEWCTADIKEIIQIIKVMDYEGPEIVLPDAVEVGTSAWQCSATWSVLVPDLSDNCSVDVHYTVSANTGVVLGNETNGYVITNLGLGVHTVIFEASDCCGNSTRKEVEVTVVDNTPPVAVCDAHTVVSLTPGVIPGKNYSKIYAETFDDGSHDNCNDVWFKVIRMDELLGTVHGAYADNTNACDGIDGDDAPNVPGNQIFFDDFVKFCCADVGQTVIIVFRVFDVDPGAGAVFPNRMATRDLKGHFTDCMVEVEVQDKTVPTMIAPPDIVVSCSYWFDDSESALTDVTNTTFGRFVSDISAREKVNTTDRVCEQYCQPNAKTNYPNNSAVAQKACDFYNTLYNPANPEALNELFWGYDGYASGSCALELSVRVDDRRECGQGAIFRYFTARAGGREYTDVQVIWVVDCDPFEVSDVCQDPSDDIFWPLNCQQPPTLEGCGANTTPDNPRLGRPVVANGGDDNCALISIDYKDQTYTIQQDGCFKILRDWVVIDWCQFDITIELRDRRTGQLNFNHPHPGEWHYLQVIKVRDNQDPTMEISIGDCEPAEKDSLWNCHGHINLTVNADDECTPDNALFYEYKIDLFNDGTLDANVGPAKPGNVPNVQNNPYADDPKDATNASGIYPFGWHKITWYIEDGCGNIGIRDSLFQIKDCKRPTPYCRTGIITVVMPSTGSITVWANDLDIGSFDNCTEPDNLKFYFNGDENWKGYEISCDSFDAHGATGSLTVQVEMWVEDEEGNTDYCNTTIEVQDPNGVCGGNVLSPAVGGTIATEGNESMANISVSLQKNGDAMLEQTTSNAGVFAFYDLPASQNYKVIPKNDKNPLNGVSTRDLVSIQKHILAIKPLNSVYQLIAADANGNEKITTADISYLRKLILGKKDKFDKVTSWVFVPMTHVFDDPSDPWTSVIPNSISYDVLTSREMNSNFVAVKMGDLTGDAQANYTGKISPRSAQTLKLMVNSQRFEGGDRVEIPVRANDFDKMQGFQFTWNYNPSVLSFEKVISGALKMSDENVGILDGGLITASWHEIGGVRVADDEVLFTMVFSAQGEGMLNEMMRISSDFTPAMAFNTEDYQFNIDLRFRSLTSEKGQFELYQNIPNPFNDETVIGFNLPEDAETTLTVYNVVGKILFVQSIQGQKGYNEVNLQTRKIQDTGVLYYQLNSGDFSATKKMIITD